MQNFRLTQVPTASLGTYSASFSSFCIPPQHTDVAPTWGCVCVCENLPSTWEQGVTPTFRLQGAIQPCYQGMANEEPDSKVLQRTCKGTETISPLCQGQNPIPTIRFGTLNVLRPARSSRSDHGSGSHSLCQHNNARDRTLIPTTRHLTTTEDRTLILTTRRDDDDIHYNIQHSSVFLTSSLCRIHQCARGCVCVWQSCH